MYKTILILCLVVSLGLAVQVVRDWPDDNLHIIFCDVGQGDAILVQYKYWQMLIDAGADDKVLTCLKEYVPFWDRHLEVVLATHMHHDHIDGLPDVFANYQVGALFLADVSPTEGFKKVLAAVKEQSWVANKIKIGILGQRIVFAPSGKLSILAPAVSPLPLLESDFKQFSETMLSDAMLAEYASPGDENERSIVLFLRYFDFDLLLMADALKKNELALIKQGLIKKVETLKIGHHGSNTSSSELFLQACRPELAVISSGFNNKYDHPSLEVLQALQAINSQILRTDELGTIHLVTNGRYYWLL